MTIMDRFPPEILSQIFSFACTDGGYTGRSLSIVSKYVHKTSKPYKYNSIRLYDVRSAAAFASFLEKSSPDIVHSILHLFVCNCGQNPDDQDMPYLPKASGTTSLRSRVSSGVSHLIPGRKRRQRRQMITESVDDLCRDGLTISAIIRVLKLVAPTLQTLTICFVSRSYTLPFLEHASPHPHFPRLPVLTELTVSYRAPLDSRFNYHFFCCPTSAASLPSLRRLDISAQAVDHHLPQTIFTHIAAIAPSLTHLCLSSRMTIDLRDALAEAGDGLLPSTLRRICILLDVCHRCTWGSKPSHCYRCHILAMSSMDPRVVLLADPGGEVIGHKSCRTLVDEWQKRISGSEVFWEESDD
jgi:hypothetical protein